MLKPDGTSVDFRIDLTICLCIKIRMQRCDDENPGNCKKSFFYKNRLKFSGVSPVNCLKSLIKWAWSKKLFS